MIVSPQPPCHKRLKSLNSFSVSLLDAPLTVVGAHIVEFAGLDPHATAFRYACDLDGHTPTLLTDGIDLLRLHDVMNGSKNFFECVDLDFTHKAEMPQRNCVTQHTFHNANRLIPLVASLFPEFCPERCRCVYSYFSYYSKRCRAAPPVRRAYGPPKLALVSPGAMRNLLPLSHPGTFNKISE
jgi:hypothetical protein